MAEGSSRSKIQPLSDKGQMDLLNDLVASIKANADPNQGLTPQQNQALRKLESVKVLLQHDQRG